MDHSQVFFNVIPKSLRQLSQWIVWRETVRDGKPTKIPLMPRTGGAAKSNDPTTWDTFENARAAFEGGGFSGPGFVFSLDDPFYGIDLDGCRDATTGIVAVWAKEIILKFGSYAEVSPSGTGVKIFGAGEPPVSGRKVVVKGVDAVCSKAPGIECYESGRFFAVTGQRLADMIHVRENNEAAAWLREKYFADEPPPSAPRPAFRSDDAVFERARRYLAKLPPAVSGQRGHDATFHAACVLVLGFGLDESAALALMHEFNDRCQPPWSEKELARKVREAAKQPGERNYLRNAAPRSWDRIAVPQYETPVPTAGAEAPTATTLADAARAYIRSLQSGSCNTVGTSVAELDYALGGGLAFGEMVIFAARPSHGKSAVALQCIHHWTAAGMPCAIVSEEMSSLVLGKRTLQFTSELPQEHWADMTQTLLGDVDAYESRRSPCLVMENCRTAEVACERIEAAVASHGIKAAVVDYAQLLQSPGRSRYEQISATSVALRQLAGRTGILLLVLCQLNREIEHRGSEFRPLMSDLRDTGQLEQDADVITFLCWPHRIDPDEPRAKYVFHVVKNRNRAINDPVVTCSWNPERQTVTDEVGGSVQY